jgi:hypothetical protein
MDCKIVHDLILFYVAQHTREVDGIFDVLHMYSYKSLNQIGQNFAIRAKLFGLWRIVF